MEIRIIDNKKNTHPNILYKYRNWDNELHKKVLTDNILYMASPRDFEDIHDCNIPKKFPKKSELYDFFLKKSKTEYPNRSRSEHRQYARYWRDKSPLGNPIQLSQLIERFNNEFNNKFGVLSLTANYDNNAMWEKYADNHKGICFGFNAKSLFECVGGGGEVQYIDKLPTINLSLIHI